MNVAFRSLNINPDLFGIVRLGISVTDCCQPYFNCTGMCGGDVLLNLGHI